MLFKTYTPATLFSNCEKARAVHTYNAVRNFCGKPEPRFDDFIAYRAEHDLTFHDRITFACDPDARAMWELSMKSEWTTIKEVIRNAGQPLQHQYVVYFVVFSNGGVKCGKTNNLVQRYCNLNRENEIESAFYLPMETDDDAKAAEHALQRIFGHSRGMVQQMNKKDYFVCDHDYAVKFIKNNKRKMYDAIMAAVGE